MNNVSKFLLLFSLIFLMTGCSLFYETHGETWVAECEHGYLQVETSLDDGSLNYTISAFPDEGYCLLRKNLFVYKTLASSLSRAKIPVTDVSENVYSCSVNKDDDMIITAVFTKEEIE